MWAPCVGNYLDLIMIFALFSDRQRRLVALATHIQQQAAAEERVLYAFDDSKVLSLKVVVLFLTGLNTDTVGLFSQCHRLTITLQHLGER